MDFEDHHILVSWQSSCREPSKRPPVLWQAKDFYAPSQPQDAVAIDRLLGASGALECLKTAFSRNCNRRDAWVGQDLSPDQLLVLRSAGRVFKRGVNVLPRDGTEFSGDSSIRFYPSLGPLIQDLKKSDYILVDKAVQKAWWHRLPSEVQVVEVSERSKDLGAAAGIYEQIPAGIKRVVIVGGGVLGDIAGFAAAQRHLPTVYVPTTLLAMTDSSIGGKTGVNFAPYGKNQVGRFHPPSEVLISGDWLQTLPSRELKAGVVEGLKHALLAGDKDLWQNLIRIARSQTWYELTPLLPAIVSIKANIVRRDPFEAHERAVLNLGHTLGHALESLSHRLDGEQALNHGEAVAHGLCYALLLSKRECGFKDADHYVEDLKSAGVLVELSSKLLSHLDDVPKILIADKKNDDAAAVRWVLLSDFGKVAQGPQGEWTIPLVNEFDKNLLFSGNHGINQ